MGFFASLFLIFGLAKRPETVPIVVHFGVGLGVALLVVAWFWARVDDVSPRERAMTVGMTTFPAALFLPTELKSFFSPSLYFSIEEMANYWLVAVLQLNFATIALWIARPRQVNEETRH